MTKKKQVVVEEKKQKSGKKLSIGKSEKITLLYNKMHGEFTDTRKSLKEQLK